MPRLLAALGAMPSPLLPTFYIWLNSLVTYCAEQCPVSRPTAYYIKQAAGATSGTGSQSDPYTVADLLALQALIDTLPEYQSGAGSLSILLRSGDIFRPNATTPEGNGVQIVVGQVTLDAWTDSAANQPNARIRNRPPIISAFTTPVTSGWTQVGVTTWWYRDYTSTTRPYWVQFSDADATRGMNTDTMRFRDKTGSAGPFTDIADANLAAVLADATDENAFTLLHDVGSGVYRAYCKLAGGGSPNTATSLEVAQAASQTAGRGVDVGNVDGVRVRNLIGMGFGLGFRNTSTQATVWGGTQMPPFCTRASGTNLTVFENLESYVSGTHLIESYASSDGGSLVCLNCTVGWCTGTNASTATMIEGFCPTTGNAGNNELVAVGARCKYGALNVDSFTGYSGRVIDVVYNHTGSTSFPPALTIAAFVSIDDSAAVNNVRINVYGGDAKVPSVVTDPSTYTMVAFRCDAGGGTGVLFNINSKSVASGCRAPRACLSNISTAVINTSFNAAGTYCYMAIVGNCDILLDLTQQTVSTSNKYFQYYSRGAGSNKIFLGWTNNRFQVRLTDKNDSFEFFNRFQAADAADSYIVNCEFYVQIGESGLQGANIAPSMMGLSNQPATASQGGYANCAFMGLQPVNTGTFIGYNLGAGFLDSSTLGGGFASPPGAGYAHPALAGLGTGNPAPALATTMDINGLKRSATSPTVGPYESLSQIATDQQLQARGNRLRFVD